MMKNFAKETSEKSSDEVVPEEKKRVSCDWIRLEIEDLQNEL